ncbi:alpha/beta-hydrolase [Laetiporus sulphureus 93-53]|uniref:Alpha/beta-hydrolase n=1 Tax=Laetiporus sulphureus 93-53 TaxID=1314785 RepID=A0A165HQJ2_9APHY|nr:alpha/beta-hydrolase [Laetiporus sulphureus 93-53]KZT12053.1 alpha/beta-hydrolase [Laetiporus sulphureus 93-53]
MRVSILLSAVLLLVGGAVVDVAAAPAKAVRGPSSSRALGHGARTRRFRRDSTPFLDPSALVTLSTSEISEFEPYLEMARAAYCAPSLTADWECGEACDAVSDFTTYLSGGDGDSIQYYYVGYWASENAVVVAHQGTDPTQLLSDLTDVDIITENLNSTYFPGVSSSVYVHSGFADEQADTARIILEQTKSIISSTGADTVICVGHSLGAALAELDAMMFALNLDSDIAVVGRTFGTPRVGNPDWADLFDEMVPDFTRMNNMKDPIPIVPGRSLGFEHPETEVHVVSEADNDVVACPGNEDATDADCTIMTVPNILDSDILDHLGPYPGNIYIGTIYCT